MSLQAPSSGRPSSSLHFVVGEMSGKLDQVLGAILLDRAEVAAKFTAHDQRITTLESWRWKVAGGVSIIIFIGGAVEALLNVKR